MNVSISIQVQPPEQRNSVNFVVSKIKSLSIESINKRANTVNEKCEMRC